MESNTIIRVLLLLTLCTSNLQTRNASNFHKDDEYERKTCKTLMKKLDESEDILKGMSDDLEKLRQLKDFNCVEEQKEDKHNFSLSNKTSSIPVAVQSDACGLINTTYEIPFESTDEFLHPFCITVMTCGGCCMPKRRCVTTKIKTLQVITKKFKRGNFTGTPYLVTYKSASKCECQCKRKETDCPGRQRVNPQCECHCPDDVKKLCPAKKQWSPSKCDCECSATDKSCLSDYQWNSNTCGCEKTNVIPTCDSGKSLNSTSCVCN